MSKATSALWGVGKGVEALQPTGTTKAEIGTGPSIHTRYITLSKEHRKPEKNRKMKKRKASTLADHRTNRQKNLRRDHADGYTFKGRCRGQDAAKCGREQPKTFPFLKLPAELRIAIYDLCLDWNDINTHLRNLKRNLPSVQDAEKARQQSSRDLDSECHWCRNSPQMHHIRPTSAKACLHGYRDSLLKEICPRRKTPSLLVVCKQITDEALGELTKRPLVLDWPYPLYGHPDLVPVFPLNHFINPRTLRKVPHLTIRTTTAHVFREVVQYTSGADLLGSWSHLQIMLKSEVSDGTMRKPDLEIEMVDDSEDIATDTGMLPYGVSWSTDDASCFIKRIVLSLMTIWTMEYLRTSDLTSSKETLLEAGAKGLEEWEKAPRVTFPGDMFCSNPAAHHPS
ncbi:Tyrosinase [Venturia nashicola]|uniref:Tyrosinase n=1 Tax=Venturia nashicola TaxID=86259 RepID=A0A4Z1NY65_9PEZI|nr:Tyrosinase [Venturia nashicola]TLD32541.1 Tyrosinase [Venturia nashicola]